MDAWTIYWITRLDAINGLVVFIAILLGMASIGCGLAVIDKQTNKQFRNLYDADEMSAKLKFWFRKLYLFVILTVFFSAASTLIPTTKEFAAIYLIPKIANNAEVQKIPNNTLKLLNAKLEEWIDESLKDKTEKK